MQDIRAKFMKAIQILGVLEQEIFQNVKLVASQSQTRCEDAAVDIRVLLQWLKT